MSLNDITRLEIIDASGRAFGRYDLDGVTLSGQDDGRTLKIFLEHDGESETSTFTILSAAANWLSQDEPNVEMALSAIQDHLGEMMEELDER